MKKIPQTLKLGLLSFFSLFCLQGHALLECNLVSVDPRGYELPLPASLNMEELNFYMENERVRAVVDSKKEKVAALAWIIADSDPNEGETEKVYSIGINQFAIFSEDHSSLRIAGGVNDLNQPTSVEYACEENNESITVADKNLAVLAQNSLISSENVSVSNNANLDLSEEATTASKIVSELAKKAVNGNEIKALRTSCALEGISVDKEELSFSESYLCHTSFPLEVSIDENESELLNHHFVYEFVIYKEIEEATNGEFEAKVAAYAIAENQATVISD